MPLYFKIYRIINFFYELYSEFILTKKLTKQIVTFGQLHNVDRVWCILQGQTTIRLAMKVQKGLNVPLLTQVWDHVSWWIGHNDINKLTAKRIINQYERALSMSACCGAASYAMAELIKKDGIPAIPLVSSLPKNITYRAYPSSDKNSDTIIIGFAGQTYAESTFNSLLDGLDSIGWKHENKMVKFRILGYNLSNVSLFDISLKGHINRNIEYLGYRSQVETIDLLSECDILFCPYIIDPKYSLVAQTSFPAKLTTYLATGVPVLYCGPSDSSPAVFLKEHEAGYICADPDGYSLMKMFKHIISDKEYYRYISKNALKAFKTHLADDVQKNSFNQFIHYGDQK